MKHTDPKPPHFDPQMFWTDGDIQYHFVNRKRDMFTRRVLKTSDIRINARHKLTKAKRNEILQGIVDELNDELTTIADWSYRGMT